MKNGKMIEVYGSNMHYIDEGEGEPILFLHGIPTSSYIWRNIIPLLAPLGRCIAPDLIGFGHSDKPNIEYSVKDHIKYLEKFIEKLELKNITFVMHAWGSVIGFDYAMRHEKNCKGLVFYESFLRTMEPFDDALALHEHLTLLEQQDNIYDLVMSNNVFVDKIITPMAMSELSDEAMDHYKKPFSQEGSGKPVLQYLKEVAICNNKSDINKIIVNYTNKLTESYLPKLLLYSVPGFITTIATVMWAKENLPNLEIADMGEELHFAQESNPKLVGETISVWLQSIEQMNV